jgi:triosephosphate isomerase
LLAEEELDGVLVGGASLEADSWLRILETAVRREK